MNNNIEKSPYKLLNINSTLENFFFFLVIGFFLIIFGGSFYDLSGDLPKWYFKLISIPLSDSYLYLYLIISFIIFGLYITGYTEKKESLARCIIKHLFPSFIRVGLNLGSTICGMYAGLSFGLKLTIFIGSVDPEFAEEASIFLCLSFLYLSVIIPCGIFISCALDLEKKYSFWNTTLGILYVIWSIIIPFFYFKLLVIIDFSIPILLVLFFYRIKKIPRHC